MGMACTSSWADLAARATASWSSGSTSERIFARASRSSRGLQCVVVRVRGDDESRGHRKPCRRQLPQICALAAHEGGVAEADLVEEAHRLQLCRRRHSVPSCLRVLGHRFAPHVKRSAHAVGPGVLRPGSPSRPPLDFVAMVAAWDRRSQGQRSHRSSGDRFHRSPHPILAIPSPS